MAYFKDGDLTVIAKNQVDKFDYDALDIFDRGAGYINELAKNNFFLDGLKNYIRKNMGKLGCEKEPIEKEEILALVKKCYNDAGMKGDRGKGSESYNPGMIKKWIEGTTPSRKEAYRFCFCMKMGIAEAEEFLFKGCLMKPFNFKDIAESVYYFCLNTEKSFLEAMALIDTIEAETGIDNQAPENDTRIIGERIKAITDEKELISYLCNNKAGFKEQSRRAIKELNKQIGRAEKFAEWERKAFFEDYGIPKIQSSDDVPAILNVILGYGARVTEKGDEKSKDKAYKGKSVYLKTITDSEFPSLIKDNFPQPQQLVMCLKSDVPSVETLRKAIILFVFYNHFAELRQKRIDCYGGKYFDEFSAKLDKVLLDCGYTQMYWRHPYDWMFGYCANADEPLDELREMISCFYLDDEDIYSPWN